MHNTLPPDPRSPLLDIALDLCANITAQDRYAKLIDAVARMLPCDSAALLRLEGDVLVAIATRGLRAEVDGIRFLPAQHPRLARLLETPGPVRFRDGRLPDPFDGLVVAGDVTNRVHACMGCALVVEGQVVGVLAADALDPEAFDGVDDASVATLAALAGAAVRSAQLVDALESACERQRLVARQLYREVQQHRGGEILGQSEPIQRLRREIRLLAGSDLAVLITGETGVGKELVARATHAGSARRERPLIYVNCAALPESIAESELFGHVRGAFTGARDSRPGRFEAADGGTLFLDEVGELSLSVQPKLLRALQSGEIQRLGSDRPVHVDVRVLAATNRDLAAEVEAGRFRADLYHRLSPYPVRVPPLRERPDDVPGLAGHFLGMAASRFGVGRFRVGPAEMARLQAYEWPGNVRELEHLLMRAALKASASGSRDLVVIEARHLDLPEAPGAAPAAAPPGLAVDVDGLSLADATEAFRRELVRRALAQAGGNWSEAARRLGVDRGNLHRLGARLGLR